MSCAGTGEPALLLRIEHIILNFRVLVHTLDGTWTMETPSIHIRFSNLLKVREG